MGFTAKDKGKTVYGIIAVIHEHFDIIQNAGVKVLCLINGKQEWLAFLPVEVSYLFLNGFEHTGFSAFVGNAKYGTELFVKIGYTDGGKAQIFHVVKAWVQAGGKTAQGIRFAHARSCSKNTNSPDIFKIVEPVGHFGEIFGDKVVFFLHLLFVKRVVGKPVKRVEHQDSPPILE